ncbi:MAG: glycosyltransferase family 39 protein [Deltaproteobacteria bacterium]|nr:glycosyltransferase family 39 protein [Deltaproteobacteria bacterium]
MGFLGVDFMPDANPASPEWALRLPTLAMTLFALAVIYATTRRYFGPRAGVLATLVTATMPQFFFISHQAITDLPLVAAITIASCCLIVAMHEGQNREVTVFQIGRWRVSLQHVVVFAIVLLILPQAVYLISRNISWVEGYGLVAHPDRFLYGSAGNLDIPGNPSPRDQTPRVRGIGGQPFVQGVLWLAVLSALAMRLRKERRMRPLLMYSFYFFCAIAFMAKGLLGLAIPGAAALFYLIASRRWAMLGSGELRVSTGVLIVTAVSLPWYVAMYVRHGPAFTNRLLIHDHINRLASGVHGDKGTVEYFLAQIGYATFPWIALVPAALMVCLSIRSRSDRDGRGEMLLFLAMPRGHLDRDRTRAVVGSETARCDTACRCGSSVHGDGVRMAQRRSAGNRPRGRDARRELGPSTGATDAGGRTDRPRRRGRLARAARFDQGRDQADPFALEHGPRRRVAHRRLPGCVRRTRSELGDLRPSPR